MDKKGVELSVNFLIVIILSIMVISFGFFIINAIFEKGEEYQRSVSETSKREIDAVLSRGEPVAIPRNVKTLRNGEEHIFGIGISSVGGAGNTFSVNIPDSVPGLKIIKPSELGSIHIPSGGKTYIPVKVIVTLPGPASRVIGVEVCHNAGAGDACAGNPAHKRYFAKQNIFVNVP